MLPCQAVSRAGARACPRVARGDSVIVGPGSRACLQERAGRPPGSPALLLLAEMAVRRQGGRLTGPRCAGGQRGAAVSAWEHWGCMRPTRQIPAREPGASWSGLLLISLLPNECGGRYALWGFL